MKFRKKPVVIEAVQFMGDAGVAEIAALGLPCRRSDDGMCDVLEIPTLEGTLIATPGDWIITGVKGERYPCKPDVFAATYEPAE